MEVHFDIQNPLTNSTTTNLSSSSSYLSHLFLLESDHMVSQIYPHRLLSFDFNFSLRRDTISIILQFCGSFDPFLSYLAVNYLDRFFSHQGMPVQKKPWVMRLLALTCVSLAAKMMKTEFRLCHFQCEEGFIFDSQTIERMEMLILGALKWRMRSITPFAFLQFFTNFFKLKDPPLRDALKARALEIIFKAQNEIRVLEFKASIVAASALVCASHELFPIQFPSFHKSITSCSFVDKEKLEACINVIARDGNEEKEGSVVKSGAILMTSVWSSMVTPVNVLDHQWSSSSIYSAPSTTNLISSITSHSHTSKTKITEEDTTTEERERERKRQRKGCH